MGDPMLTHDAPESDSAAIEAPVDGQAAPVGSVDSTDVIPKERFNGLMSKYNADRSAWDAEKMALLNELDMARSQKVEENNMADEQVLSEIQALRAELASQKLETARAEAVAKYPAAAPLADLIVGNTPQEIEAMAAELSNRLSVLVPVGETAAQPVEAEVPSSENVGSEPAAGTPVTEVPTIGGAAAFQSEVAIDEAIGQALEAKDFSAFLRAAQQRAVLHNGAEL